MREYKPLESPHIPPPRARRVLAGGTSRPAPPSDRLDPVLLWFGGGAAVLAIVLAIVLHALWGTFPGVFPEGERVFAEQPGAGRALANRTDCGEIGRSDLRSPEEGVWYETNCAPAQKAAGAVPASECDRAALDPREFTEVAPGLFLYRQVGSWSTYLWYHSGENCFDLVSSRVVTAVCVDRTVTFKWTHDACAGHGGVLVRVNGR